MPNGRYISPTYDNAGRLTSLTNPLGEATAYAYEAGNKFLKAGSIIDYHLDGNYVIMKAEGVSMMAYYIQGQGSISQRRGSSSYFYHYDGLGSAKALTDANQNVQASYIYDAWGNVLQTNGTIVNPYLYVGELSYYADGDAGMYLLTQRWYNPVVGRFVARAPLLPSFTPSPWLKSMDLPDLPYRGGIPPEVPIPGMTPGIIPGTPGWRCPCGNKGICDGLCMQWCKKYPPRGGFPGEPICGKGAHVGAFLAFAILVLRTLQRRRKDA